MIVGAVFTSSRNEDSPETSGLKGNLWCRSFESFFHLFSSQLLVQSGDVVIPLCLVAGSSHRGSQVVFLPEGLDLELSTAVSRAVGEDRLGAGQGIGLLIDQPHVPVKT